MDCCLKIHRREGEVLVAACDRDALGKTFSEGEFELRVESRFYGEEAKRIEDVLDALQDASIGNLTGNEVVNAAICAGYVEEGCVLSIGGVKHAQFVVMH